MMWKRTELRAQKGQYQIWKPQMPSMTTHLGTWQIACGEWSHWPQQKLGCLESDPHDNSKANPEGDRQWVQTEVPTDIQRPDVPAPHHPRDSISELWTGNEWTLPRSRGELGSHCGLFLLQGGTMHGKRRQGDAGIGESGHDLDGQPAKWPPRALDPGEWRLGHFCGILWKQYSNREPKGPGALQLLVPDGRDFGWARSSTHSDCSFHYSHSCFAQACVPFLLLQL